MGGAAGVNYNAGTATAGMPGQDGRDATGRGANGAAGGAGIVILKIGAFRQGYQID